LHVQPNRDLWDVLQTGKIKRRQPLTGPSRPPASTATRFATSSGQVGGAGTRRRGERQSNSSRCIYAAEPEDDWTSPETWRKANPNLGVSIREEDIAAGVREGQRDSRLRKHVQAVAPEFWTEQDVRWLSLESWRKGDAELPDLEGEPCWCGLDLSTTTDLSAFAMAFPREAGGYYLLVKFWAPQERARQRARRDRVPYLEWAQQGFLKLTPGDVVDYDVIRADINALNERYRFKTSRSTVGTPRKSQRNSKATGSTSICSGRAMPR
jgi:hypothetical protein